MSPKAQKKLEEYVTDTELSMTQRGAHFLHWAAQHMPNVFQSYPVIYKAITGQRSLPRANSEHVELLKRNVTGMRTALLKHYNREVVSLPGIGIRATVDDADRLANVAPAKARRLDAARKSFMITATGIDLRKVPDTAEYAGLKKWMGRSVRDVLDQIGSDEFTRKLLPPTTGDDSAKK